MSDAIFDVHTHPLLPAYVQALTEESGSADGVTLSPWSGEQHIEVMDQHGIDVGILSQPALAEHLVGSEGQAIAPAIKAFFAYSGFNEDEKHKIARGNAACLFPRLG
ncbi:hypothetical protein [Nostoc sp. ChiQUE01b]|uniref:hypothetical protein n=1 Tax=Nostoc sp. ChiQUE01b TaxID=3075376 RepID=UPI002AD4A302|nr:hypothetical protein [Nostoc sp. ChiQUE01b]MDZ8259895.1 hypothetical protein [Nostoc sp. ChiQUE01b]